jgi:putative FmdB family regulatory protein
MPLYEFECQDCKENFEKLMRITGMQEAVCPSCGSVRTLKKISAVAASVKGSSASGGFSGASSCAPTST